MTGSTAAIAASRAFCRQTARRAGSNFYASFFLLSRPKREAMEALYAFLRHTDDLGDSPGPVEARRAALACWRARVQAALAGVQQSVPSPLTGEGQRVRGPRDKMTTLSLDTHLAAETEPIGTCSAEDPFALLLPALVDAVRCFSIPPEHLLAVLDGVGMDLAGRRYETFDELADYCRHVASAVGLACIHIWGFCGEEALEPARQCGIAFQLTNILRDLKEDTARGRLYLPAEDLRRCGYSDPCSTLEHAVAHGLADDRFARLMALEIGRAKQCYREGAELFAFLKPEGRRALGMMTSTYWRLLEEIQRRPDRVLAGPVRLGRWQKLRIAARWLLLPPRRSSLR